MIYIVEGIDRVGKTTFCNKFSKVSGYKVFHDKYPFRFTKDTPCLNDILEVKYNMLIQMIEMFSTSNLIVDRFHMSEYVYDYFRDITFNQYDKLDELLANYDTQLILIKSENIKESSRQHGVDLSQHELLFEALFKTTKIKDREIITYNKIENYIRRFECLKTMT